MPPPTLISRIRHTIARAIRETGQALDRVGIRGDVHVKTNRQLGDDPYKFQDHLSRHRNLMPLMRRGQPQIHHDVAFIAPCSSIMGCVEIGSGSSVWYGAIVKADKANMGMGHDSVTYHRWRSMTTEQRQRLDADYDGSAAGGGIYIGSNTNIQDGCIIQAEMDHTQIGNYVTVGHGASINSAIVQDFCLIGMGSILQPGCKVETCSLVAAGAVIGKNQIVPSGEFWIGNPARKLRNLSDKEIQKLKYQAEEYVKVSTNQNHVMDLGGNIPDDFLQLHSTMQQEEQYLLSKASDTNETNSTVMDDEIDDINKQSNKSS